MILDFEGDFLDNDRASDTVLINEIMSAVHFL